MLAEAVTYALLTGAGPVTAIVATRIYPVVVPRGQGVPAITVEVVSDAPLPALDAQAATHLARARVQVNLVGPSLTVLNTLRAAVKAAMAFKRGAIGGTTVHSVLWAGDGPGSFDQPTDLFHRPVDFLITYEQP